MSSAATVEVQDEPTSTVCDRPLDVETSIAPSTSPRIFYGWVMLPLAMLVMVATSPGQTFGLTFFNTKFRNAFDLSQTQLSTTYLLATVLASLTLPYIGGLTDRFGLKRSILVAVATMAAICALASQVQGVASLFVVFALLRMIGPGTMVLLANNTLATWFDRRLGTVSGIMHVVMAGTIAVIPVFIVTLIDTFGWRGAYLALAAILGLGLTPLLMLLYRESPDTLGQFLDGARTHCKDQAQRAAWGLDVRQAMQHRAYWILLAAAATWALIGTGLVFHLDAIFQSYGLGVRQSTHAMGFLAIAMATTQIVGGFLADRIALRWLVVFALSFISISCIMLASQNVRLLIPSYATYGCGQGLMTILAGTAWARYFGRAHLGKIRGMSITAAIAGSSLGPLIMGISIDYRGSFTPSLWFFAALAATLALAGFWATPPVRNKC